MTLAKPKLNTLFLIRKVIRKTQFMRRHLGGLRLACPAAVDTQLTHKAKKKQYE